MTAMLRKTHFLHCLIVGTLAVGCGIDPSSASGPVGTAGSGGSGGGANMPPCAYGQIVCDQNSAKVCDGRGSFTSTTPCTGTDKCRDGLGCVSCTPNTNTCANKLLTVCDSAGNPT